jgi:hypothetical protein
VENGWKLLFLGLRADFYILTNVLMSTKPRLLEGMQRKCTEIEDLGDLLARFPVLRKCKNKFDCLVFETLSIKELKPTLNAQSDSIKSKLF